MEHTKAFDFTTLPNRNNTGCTKWDRRTDAEKAADIVPMSIADMDLCCAPCVMEAIEAAARHGVFGYTDAEDVYFDAVMGWMERRHDWRIEREWILPENGVVPAMSVAVRTFTEPGDGVLLQSPGYPPFEMMVTLNGREAVFSPLLLRDDETYQMDFDDLREKAADPRVKLMFLCSPHNPTGRVWTEAELRMVADICRENDVFVVSDEIHSDMIMKGKHTVFAKAAPEIADRCMVFTAPSKTFNIAGLQVANTIIPGADARERFAKRMLADGVSNISYFGRQAVIAAYLQGEPWLEALLAHIRENFEFFKNWLHTNLPMLRLMPAEGTYLAWMDCRALGMTDAELERFMRGEAMLFLDEGTMFGAGGEGFMRFTLVLPRHELEKALERLLAAARIRKIV